MFIHSRSSLGNPTRFQTKMAKVYTRFQTKMAQKPYPIGGGGAHTYIAYIREYPPGLNPTKFDSSRFERTTYACCRIVIKTSGIAFIQGGKVFISVVSDVRNNSGRPLRKNKNVLEISSNILTMKPASKLSVA